MNRKTFIQLLSLLPLAGLAQKMNKINQLITSFSPTPKMPAFFLGHGSPMNAIEENEFVAGFRKIGKTIAKPNAILCISAHWETRGTKVTAMEHPRTIHDFGGFPKELHDVQYPAPGSPQLASDIQKHLLPTAVELDHHWGLDHGSWSVIKHLYPLADVPVIQMSIDYTMSPQEHFELAQQIAEWRNRGILIIGSGNMVHNLGLVAWNKLNEAYAYDWAIEARSKMNESILNGDFQALINFKTQGTAFDLAIPTPEHFIPLLYTLALKDSNEDIQLFNDKPLAGSLTMTSIQIG